MKEKPVKKSTKSNKPINRLAGDQHNRSPYSEARDKLGYFQEFGDRQRWIVEKLEEWSRRPTSIQFFDFLDEFGIPESTYYDAINRDPEILDLHNRAKQRIGSRREKMAIYKYNECNEKSLHYTMRIYNDDWRKVYDEDMKNKKELAEKGMNEPVVVKLERD
jgi:hypothetical protein